MNSEKLKAAFPSEYRDFFLGNPIVISMPLVMTWSGDYSPAFSGLNIKQKLPLRVYVGVSFEPESGVSFGEITCFSPEKNAFLKTGLKNYSPYFREIESLIQDPKLRSARGLRINVLSELPGNVGLSFESVVGMLIVSAMERVSGGLDDAMLQEIKTETLAQAWSRFQSRLSPLFNASYAFVISSCKSFPITGDISASFYSGAHPFVTFSTPQDFAEDYDKIVYKGEKSQIARFNELVRGLGKFPNIPVDYALVDSSQPVSMEQVIHANSHVFDWVRSAKGELRGIFNGLIESESWASWLYASLLDDRNNDFENAHSKFMLAVSFEIFHYLVALNREGYSKTNISGFLFALNKLRYSNYARCSSSDFLRFLERLERALWGSESFGICANNTTSMGWTLNVAFWSGERDTFEKAMESLVSTGGRVLYRSWEDGIESEGIRFEQDVGRSIYSAYADQGTCFFRSIPGGTCVTDYSTFVFPESVDVVLDRIGGKIVFASGMPNSKAISSHSATVEIFSKLLSKEGFTAHCSELGASSYSKSRSELLAKIITPFKKLLSQELGREFDVAMAGSASDFHVSLNVCDIRFGIIEKSKSIT